MREIQDEQLRFVARFFSPGRFDVRRAWRRFRTGERVPAWNWGYTWAVAGAFAALALGVFLFARAERAWTEIPATAVARTVVLPDGTQATLAPAAMLSFRRHGFGRRDRAVRMDGKVYFAVAHREDLPFEITAAEGFVRVLGTRFQVETDGTGTAVDVVDGRVLFAAAQAVRTSSGEPAGGLVLTRGMHAELASGAARPALGEPQTANPAAWATHAFHYEDTPLEEVLDELSAVFCRRVTAGQGDRRLTGDFAGTDLEETVALIEAALDLDITIE